MYFRERYYVAAMGGLLALGLVSCGGGGGGTTGAANTGIKEGSLPKAAFLKKGNAICAETEAEINREYERFSDRHVAGKQPSEAVLNRGAEEIVLPAQIRQLHQLRALGAPQGDGQRVEEILAAFEEGIEKGKADAAALRGLGGEFAFAKAFSLAGEYGLKACGF
jgi:hypothetical protein